MGLFPGLWALKWVSISLAVQREKEEGKLSSYKLYFISEGEFFPEIIFSGFSYKCDSKYRKLVEALRL